MTNFAELPGKTAVWIKDEPAIEPPKASWREIVAHVLIVFAFGFLGYVSLMLMTGGM